MNRMAVLSGSVPVRFGSRFLPVPRFMLARGRGGVQVLEHLGLKVLKTCTPPRARGNAGEYRAYAVFVWWEGNLLSLLLRGSNKQGWGCWAADAGEYRFWNVWGLKMLKTCTPLARPRQCRGIQSMCCLCMVGRTPTFVTVSEKQ